MADEWWRNASTVVFAKTKGGANKKQKGEMADFRPTIACLRLFVARSVQSDLRGRQRRAR